MKQILTVLGTRPEAIKLCPLVKHLRERGHRVQVAATGQHTSMLRDALSAFDILPDYDQQLPRGKDGMAGLLGRMTKALDGVMENSSPSLVLVQGDTLSALAGALAAFYRRIPIAHIEAGLRTYRMDAPFPEEMHRRTIALLAQEHFTPTVEARKNLLREGVSENRIHVTGNTVVDALRITLARPAPEAICKLPTDRRMILFTAHRRENQGKTMQGMFRALRRLVETFPDTYAICPLHRNPAVRESAAVLNGCARIRVIAPPGVLHFHHLLSRAYLVMTDSGGIQEESTALGIPTLVMRYSTERCEGLRAGVLRLAGSGEEGIFSLGENLLTSTSELYESMKKPSAVFGDGRASERIASVLERL